MRFYALALAAIALAVLVYISPAIGASLLVVGVSAVLLRQVSERGGFEAPPAVESVDNPTTTEHAGGALDLARREFGLPENGSSEPLELQSPLGRIQITSGHRNHVAFVGIKWFTGEDTEMTYIVRRRKSLLDLARVVDNTPVHGSRIEYRLRQMRLGSPSEDAFDAGTSRPRLFRELLDQGLDELLNDHVYDPQFRLEDLTFTGDALQALFVPAGDPSSTPWVGGVLERLRPHIGVMQAFLNDAHIPSAQNN